MFERENMGVYRINQGWRKPLRFNMRTSPEYTINLNVLDDQYDLKSGGNIKYMIQVWTRIRKLKQILDYRLKHL